MAAQQRVAERLPAEPAVGVAGEPHPLLHALQVHVLEAAPAPAARGEAACSLAAAGCVADAAGHETRRAHGRHPVVQVIGCRRRRPPRAADYKPGPRRLATPAQRFLAER